MKQLLFAYLVFCTTQILCGQRAFLRVNTDEYGKTVSCVHDPIRNAWVEDIYIFPRENEGSSKHIERKGTIIRYPDAKATILFCHGFMCNKADVAILRMLFSYNQPGNFNFISFDFRGHGEKKEDQYCTFGKDEALDVIAAARFARKHPDLEGKPLFAYGFSMGAVSAIEAQAKEKDNLFDAMILDCPFDSSENILKKCIDSLKVSVFGYQIDIPCKELLKKYAFHPYIQVFLKALLKAVANMNPREINICFKPVSPVESIKKIAVPCLFIHCRNDEKVSTEAIKAVYEGAQGYKKLWITDGDCHYASPFKKPEHYAYRVCRFLNDVMSGHIYDKKNQQRVVEDISEVYVIKY